MSDISNFLFCESCKIYIEKPLYTKKTRCPICGILIEKSDYNNNKDIFDNCYSLKYSGEE